MFIGRKNGVIYGAWSVPQPNDADHAGILELSDDHPDVIAFLNRPQPQTKDIVDEIAALPPARLAALKAELAKP